MKVSAANRRWSPVINNHIHHFAQIDNVYAVELMPGFTGGGGGGHHTAVGMYVAHNLIHDTPHVGVLFGSWDSVFEYNEIFRYRQVSNDMVVSMATISTIEWVIKPSVTTFLKARMTATDLFRSRSPRYAHLWKRRLF